KHRSTRMEVTPTKVGVQSSLKMYWIPAFAGMTYTRRTDMAATLHAPHQHIQVQNDKERFLIELFDTLWERYRGRMEYVRMYEKLIEQHKAAFVNDHIAFRTIAWEKPMLGIFMISRIFEALGYSMANAYEFPDKHFSSIHYQHPNPQFPKLFITQ